MGSVNTCRHVILCIKDKERRHKTFTNIKKKDTSPAHSEHQHMQSQGPLLPQSEWMGLLYLYTLLEAPVPEKKKDLQFRSYNLQCKEK